MWSIVTFTEQIERGDVNHPVGGNGKKMRPLCNFSELIKMITTVVYIDLYAG